MKPFRIIVKSFKDSFKSIFRNFSLSIASMSCTAVTLILVSLAILFSYNINSINSNIKNVLTIVVFVESDASDEEINKLKQELISLENINKNKIEYNSKEAIKKDLSEKDEDLAAIFKEIGENENPISSSFIIKVNDVHKITATAKKISKLENVSSVKYGENVVNKVVSMFDIVSKACIIAVIALVIVTAFLISNTIKITIFSRRNELSIMRLVGTSNIVIKLPFLIEGFVLGVLGAILPILLTIYGYSFVYEYTGGKFLINIMALVKPQNIIYQTSLILLIVGGLVGMFGSLRAVRRYLKV